MVNLTERQEEAVASIALAAKQFTTCTVSLMQRTGLDKVKGFKFMMYIDPELESTDGDTIIGSIGNIDKKDSFGCVGLGKKVGKNEYEIYGYSTPELKRILEENHV